jgi:hypothetical protein
VATEEEEGKDSATYKKSRPGGGPSTYGQIRVQPEIENVRYYDAEGNRFDPNQPMDPIKRAALEQALEKKKWQPVTDLLEKLETYQYWNRQAFRAAAKAEAAMNDYLQTKRNASQWVQDHASNKEQEIIDLRKRTRVNEANERSLLEALFFIK